MVSGDPFCLWPGGKLGWYVLSRAKDNVQHLRLFYGCVCGPTSEVPDEGLKENVSEEVSLEAEVTHYNMVAGSLREEALGFVSR